MNSEFPNKQKLLKKQADNGYVKLTDLIASAKKRFTDSTATRIDTRDSHDTQNTSTREDWLREKPERNALLSILIADFWSTFVEQRKKILNNDSFELFHSSRLNKQKEYAALIPVIPENIFVRIKRIFSQKTDDFSDQQNILLSLRYFTDETFKSALKEWYIGRSQRLEIEFERDKVTLDRIFDRCCELIENGRESGMIASDDCEFFIKRGLNTGLSVIFGIFELAPKVLKNAQIPVTSTNVKLLIENSYGLIAYISNLHSHRAVPLLNVLEDTRSDFWFNPKYFTVKQVQGRLVLTINDALLGKVRSQNGQRIVNMDVSSVATGCPARYSKGETYDVNREIFMWILALAEKHYFPAFS